MTTYNTKTDITDSPAATGGFSWHRVGQLYRYYSTVTRKQTLIYFITSVICAALTLLPVPELLQTGFFSLVWTILPIIYTLAPCAFGQQSASPIVERLLPARTSEKMLFFLTYFFIIMPLAVFALPVGALWLYAKIPSIQTDEMMILLDIKNSNPLIIQGFNLLSTIATVLICLLVVEHAHTNKIFKGVIAVIVTNIVVGILGAIKGISYVIEKGFKDGKSGIDTQDTQAITMQIMDELANSDYMFVMYALLIIVGGVLIWQLYRTLSRRNL